MSEKRFNDFPSHTILVTQVYEDDFINDYRMAQDIFRSFNIPENRKCFITVFNAKKDSINVPADHSVPCIEDKNRNIGQYVIYPVLDSLLYYSFHKSEEIFAERCRPLSRTVTCMTYKTLKTPIKILCGGLRPISYL